MTEVELITTARELISSGNWRLGELAYHWTEKYADGSTDADFAEKVEVHPDAVWKARTVWTRFVSPEAELFRIDGLTWTHHLRAMKWKEPMKWLQQAKDEGWSAKVMCQLHPDDEERSDTGAEKPTADAAASPSVSGNSTADKASSAAALKSATKSGRTSSAVQSVASAGRQPADKDKPVNPMNGVQLAVEQLTESIRELSGSASELTDLADRLLDLAMLARQRAKEAG